MSVAKAAAVDIDVFKDGVEVKEEEKKSKTDKKILKAADKAVRKLDNVISDLHKVANDFDDAVNSIVASSEFDKKDEDRLQEASEITHATATILFQLVGRMARKYSGKEVSDLSEKKRKALKE